MRNKLFLGIIILLTAVLAIALYKEGHWWGDDFALYISQAKAICNGAINDLITTNKFAIDNSSATGFTPTAAPWGFPILLTPLVYLWGINIEVFKILIVIFFLGFLVMYYFTFKESVPKHFLLLAVALLGMNIYFLGMLNNIQSEIPYLFFALLSLWMVNHFLKQPTIAKGICLGFIIWFTFSIRTEGFLWLAALFAGQLAAFISKKKKDAIIRLLLPYSMPYISFLLFFALGSLIFPNGFLDHANRIAIPNLIEAKDSINLYFSRFSLALTGTSSMIVQFSIIVFFLMGIIYRFSKDIPVVVYTLLVIVLFIVWPFREFRYAMLLFPFVFYFILQGIIIIAGKIVPDSFRPAIVMALLSCCIIMNGFYLYDIIEYEYQMDDYAYKEGPETLESQEMFTYIKEKTIPADTVLFFRPRAMALYTNRKSAMIFDNWVNVMRKGSYYVFNKDPDAICQFKAEHPFFQTVQFKEHFSRVYENNKFIVYLIKR